jgi:hypothetical protein
MQGTAHKPWDEKHAVSSEYQMTKFNSSNTSSRIGNGKKKNGVEGSNCPRLLRARMKTFENG